MTPRRGFVLLAVLSALVIMAMVVAVGAQRALVAARQGVLDVARAELALAVAGAQASALVAPVDSVAALAAPPGTILAAGEAAAGAARAQWTIASTLAPFATIEIDGRAPAFRGAVRTRHRLLVVAFQDSVRIVRWGRAGGAGWQQMPMR